MQTGQDDKGRLMCRDGLCIYTGVDGRVRLHGEAGLSGRPLIMHCQRETFASKSWGETVMECIPNRGEEEESVPCSTFSTVPY